MKTLRKDILVVVSLVVVFVFCGGAFGADVIDEPRDIVDISYSQNIAMTLGDNLMERIGGSDFVVDKGIGEYYILFGKEESGGVIFGGYVETDNVFSNGSNPNYMGFCNGLIDRNTFLEGSSPDYALGIYDPDGGQFALLYNSGALVFDENLTFWESGMNLISGSGLIEYDSISGGIVGGLVFGADLSEVIEFEHTVLTPVPEPATLTLICLGGLALVRKRRRGK